MTEALSQGAWRGAAALLALLPILVGMPKRERLATGAFAVVAMLAGASLWWIEAIDGPTLKSAVLRGNTLFAGLLMVTSVVLATSGLVKMVADRRWALWGGVAVLVGSLFVLDGIELADQVRQLAFLKSSMVPYPVAAAAVIAAVAIAVVMAGWLRGRGAVAFVAPWSVTLYLVALRAVFEPFLMTSVEGLISRVGHDLVHILIMLALLPDHSYLIGLLWNLIGLAFSKSTAVVLNVVAFMGTASFLVARTYLAPLPVHRGSSASTRRTLWAAEKTARRRSAVPAVIAAVLFGVLAIRTSTFQGTPSPPDREPLITRSAAGGTTQGVIDPAVLEDGALHVWTYEASGRSTRVFAIRKPDGSVSVCLDACLVCAPDGYAELGEDLFCLYCGTPIPISTVGQPGGCNPVPFEVESLEGELVFDVKDALDQWQQVTQGR